MNRLKIVPVYDSRSHYHMVCFSRNVFDENRYTSRKVHCLVVIHHESNGYHKQIWLFGNKHSRDTMAKSIANGKSDLPSGLVIYQSEFTSKLWQRMNASVDGVTPSFSFEEWINLALTQAGYNVSVYVGFFEESNVQVLTIIEDMVLPKVAADIEDFSFLYHDPITNEKLIGKELMDILYYPVQV